MDFFLPLAAKSPGLTAILAEAQARFGQASAAACLLAEHVVHTPASYPMLLAQSRLLLDLGLAPEALAVAKRCVDSAPAVAGAWVHLARVYAATGDPGMALVALNVAPMAHGHDAVPVEMPEPARTQNVSEVIRDMIAEEDDGDQTLATLPANSLRGTFLDAYRVLTLMLKRMAWDELLQHRSNMFLMEEPAAPGDVQADAQAQAQAQEGAAGSKARGSRRLLERWLDQLFTALYQDLMCSVIWNAQEQHAAKTGTRVEHTVGDLLRYGELALRLGRHEEALKAFQQCTSQGFCLRGLLAILDLYASDGAVEETLATVDAICQFFDINPDLPVCHATPRRAQRCCPPCHVPTQRYATPITCMHSLLPRRTRPCAS
jgi:tetratricopeptide (TPR) repeat protein